jgi:predicted RNase H-like nuclease (RuvC/YqgF family)
MDGNGDSLEEFDDAKSQEPITISHVLEQGEKISVFTDAEYKKFTDEMSGKQEYETSGSGDDLDAILKRLWKFIGGIASAEAKNEAVNRILQSFKKTDSDVEMEEKEFKDALELKEKEITELSTKLEDAINRLKEFEEKEIKVLKDSIKELSTYTDSDLDGKCLKELNIIADAVSRFEPSKNKGKKLPVSDSNAQSMNPSNIFAETNKQFRI